MLKKIQHIDSRGLFTGWRWGWLFRLSLISGVSALWCFGICNSWRCWLLWDKRSFFLSKETQFGVNLERNRERSAPMLPISGKERGNWSKHRRFFCVERMPYKAAGYADLCSCKITEYKALEHPLFFWKGSFIASLRKRIAGRTMQWELQVSNSFSL